MSFWFIPPTLSADMTRLGPDLFRCSAIDVDYTHDADAFRILYTAPQSGGDAGSNIFQVNAESDDASTGWLFKDTTSVNGKWSHCFIAVDTSVTSSYFPNGIPETVTGAAYMYVNLNRLQSQVAFETGWAFSTLPSLTSSVSPFEVTFNGKTLGIPTAPQRLNYTTISPGNPTYIQPKMQFSDIQVWVGKFIDPTVRGNLDKFVTLENGVGRPVDPKTAAAAFGKQTILLQGPAAGVTINHGTGGAFTKVGTINDYSPAPGQ